MPNFDIHLHKEEVRFAKRKDILTTEMLNYYRKLQIQLIDINKPFAKNDLSDDLITKAINR